MLAYDFPLLSMMWVLLVWAFVFEIMFAMIWAFIDNFRRPDHGGWAKAGWALLILVVPLIGMIAYIAARPSGSLGSTETTESPIGPSSAASPAEPRPA